MKRFFAVIVALMVSVSCFAYTEKDVKNQKCVFISIDTTSIENQLLAESIYADVTRMFRETTRDIYVKTGDSIWFNKTSKVEVEPNFIVFQINYVEDSDYYNAFVPISVKCYFSFGTFFYNLATMDNSKKEGMLQRYVTLMEKENIKNLVY